MTPFGIDLEELLKKDPMELIDAQKEAFKKLIAGIGECYVLFGAGGLGRDALAGLRKVGIEPLAFVDNNPRLWNTVVEGVKVISPRSAAEQFGVSVIFIITVFTSAPVWEQLNAMGLKVASFAALVWQHPDAFMPYFSVEYPHKIYQQAGRVRDVLDLWADDISRQEYLGQLLWRTSLDPSILPPHLPQKEIYFTDDLYKPITDEVFVDCGAFDGDSIQEFVKRRAGYFGRIIAIEPDPANCRALEARLNTFPPDTNSRTSIIRSALGSNRGIVTFNATGTVGASIGAGSYQVGCTPLDELLKDIKPTFIKMDIEGAEPEALLGSHKIIERDAPVLAICLYHAQEHLWQIPLLIHSLNDKGYDYFLRRYSDECWEIVCYAIPKTRSIG